MNLPPPGRPAVFLDRDGTLNVETHYLHRVEDFAWIPGAPEAVARLNRAGLDVVVVTNQSAVAHGYCEEADVVRLHRHMQESLAEHGGRIDAFYYCPFHPEGRVARYRASTDRRKPGAGMFREAIRERGIDPTRSFMVGDRNSDIEPARSLGMTTFLVETGYGSAEKERTAADRVVADLSAAAACILRLCAESDGGGTAAPDHPS